MQRVSGEYQAYSLLHSLQLSFRDLWESKGLERKRLAGGPRPVALKSSLAISSLDLSSPTEHSGRSFMAVFLLHRISGSKSQRSGSLSQRS